MDSLLAPIKKVNISSFAVETIARDIAALHNVYFDHTVFLDNEAKFFIKEFEAKRGDRDMQSLRQCAELLGSTNSLIDSSAILSSKFLDEFNQKVQDISEVITLQMPKEQLSHEQRSMERRLHVSIEEEERRVAEEQAVQRKITIDHNFQVHSQMFRDKYAFDAPPPATTPTSSSTPEASITSSGEFLMYAR